MPADTPVYPTARPAAGHGDARFSVGPALDGAVLHRHGYPRLTTGADIARLRMTLFNPIYQENKQ
jgi:hypothetical protein